MEPDLKAILRLEVPIIVQIGDCNLPMEQVLALAPGAIIELPKNADEQLELLVNNKPIGAGIAVKVGENFGIRISQVGGVRERLEAMGPEEQEAEPEDETDREKWKAEDKASRADVITARSGINFEAPPEDGDDADS